MSLKNVKKGLNKNILGMKKGGRRGVVLGSLGWRAGGFSGGGGVVCWFLFEVECWAGRRGISEASSWDYAGKG